MRWLAIMGSIDGLDRRRATGLYPAASTGASPTRLAASLALATAAMAAPVIGLAGGIGTGKSTVAQILQELGAVVIDADKVGHDVYRPGSEGFRQVVDAFGPGVVAPDGSIDRRALGAIVF